MSKAAPVKAPEKAAPRPRADTTKSPNAAKEPTEAPARTAAPKNKKSMSSRREELLKQLKAVEDAIARKRAKMN